VPSRDARPNRIVAVKVSRDCFTERFEREAGAIAALNHPNICAPYHVGPNYLVMAYVGALPLKGPLPFDQALEFAAQICEAFDAAHKKGIAHRDLKPANILVAKTGIRVWTETRLLRPAARAASRHASCSEAVFMWRSLRHPGNSQSSGELSAAVRLGAGNAGVPSGSSAALPADRRRAWRIDPSCLCLV